MRLGSWDSLVFMSRNEPMSWKSCLDPSQSPKTPKLRNYVVSNLLLPLTKPEKLSYAELAGPSQVQWQRGCTWESL